MAPDIKIIEKIEKHCLLPKLSRNYDECENHAEYEIRKTKLGTHFQQLIKLLGDLELKKSSKPSVRFLSCLLIFYKELESEGPWNDKKCKEYAKKLNAQFETSYQLTFNNLLRLNIFNAQDIFDKCMHDLHKKLTADEFKKHPGLIEVYCSIVQDIKVYNIVLCPMKIMPAMLLLIDDHVISNKIKGLMCCLAILKCLSAQDFQGGNYYEVVYKSLRTTIMEKHLKVTNVLVLCFLQFLRVLPNEAKIENADNLFTLLLDEIMVESNLYRKAMFFKLSAPVIFVLQEKCVKENMYKKHICDNLDICCDKGVALVLLPDLLVSLEEWIQNSWFVWNLSTDRHLLMMMFKVLYVCPQNNVVALCRCISTLIALSTKEEREEILSDLDKVNIQNSEFQARLLLIKNDFITE